MDMFPGVIRGSSARLAVAAAAAAVLVVPASAQGTLTIGSNLQREPDILFACAPCTAAQATLAADSQAANGILSPVNGTVTLWRIRSTGSNHSPAALRIVKPLAANLFTGAGTSAFVDPPPTSITATPTQLPIAIGDMLGLDFSNANYFVDNPGSTRVEFAPPLVDGAAGRAPDGTFTNREITINADIEPTSAFTITKAKPKKGGKIQITAQLPNAGILTAGDKSASLAVAAAGKKTKLLKRASTTVGAPGVVSLVVRATKAARSRLADNDKLKARLKLAFTPTGGAASTQVRKVKLKP
jgi:hypothetical protein